MALESGRKTTQIRGSDLTKGRNQRDASDEVHLGRLTVGVRRVVIVQHVLYGGQRHALGLKQEQVHAQRPRGVDGGEQQEHNVRADRVGHG